MENGGKVSIPVRPGGIPDPPQSLMWQHQLVSIPVRPGGIPDGYEDPIGELQRRLSQSQSGRGVFLTLGLKGKCLGWSRLNPSPAEGYS